MSLQDVNDITQSKKIFDVFSREQSKRIKSLIIVSVILVAILFFLKSLSNNEVFLNFIFKYFNCSE